jgi:hypothetical protein
MKDCVLHRGSDDLMSCEPPCWGSGEAPLIPVALKAVLKNQVLSGLVKRGKEFSIQLTSFTSQNWLNEIGSLNSVDKSDSLLDMIVLAVEECYQRSSDRFDIPFIDSPIDHFDGALNIPFEVRTSDILRNLGVKTDLDVFVLFTSTLHELRSRLGDMRAALDVAVTGSCWLLARTSGSYGFQIPKQPESLNEAGHLIRVRSFRNCGLSPEKKSYQSDFANAIGLRWAVGVSEKMTLADVGDLVGLTRERVRQIELSRPWDSPTRKWGAPKILRELADQLIEVNTSGEYRLSTGEQISREDAVALLGSYGFAEEDFEGPWQVEDELSLLGIKFSDLRRTAYVESERLGFITQTELKHHISEKYPELVGEMFDEVISQLATYRDLPYGYVYVEQFGSSYFKGWVVRVLKVYGELSISEIYKATERFCKTRIPRLVFPHRSVIEAYLSLDSEFLLKDGLVSLADEERTELTGVEKWFQTQVESCSNSVISRTELYDRARADGIKNGTLNVYFSYSLFFKPCGSGCVTLTGLNPSDTAIEIARISGMAIRIKTVRGEIEIEDGVVVLPLQVGNDLLDSGVLSTTKELRELLSGKRFQLVFGENTYGHTGWSGVSMYGNQSVLQAMSLQPGDDIRIAYHLEEGEAVVTYVSD